MTVRELAPAVSVERMLGELDEKLYTVQCAKARDVSPHYRNQIIGARGMVARLMRIVTAGDDDGANYLFPSERLTMINKSERAR